MQSTVKIRKNAWLMISNTQSGTYQQFLGVHHSGHRCTVQYHFGKNLYRVHSGRGAENRPSHSDDQRCPDIIDIEHGDIVLNVDAQRPADKADPCHHRDLWSSGQLELVYGFPDPDAGCTAIINPPFSFHTVLYQMPGNLASNTKIFTNTHSTPSRHQA